MQKHLGYFGFILFMFWLSFASQTTLNAQRICDATSEEPYIYPFSNMQSRSAGYQIPVVFHVVLPDSLNQILNDVRIQAQIDALNRDFNTLHEDRWKIWPQFKDREAKANIEFCLATENEWGEPEKGIERVVTNEKNFLDQFNSNGQEAIKYSNLGGSDAWDTDKYLNIWIGESNTIAGRSSFPESAGQAHDGIVMDYAYLGPLGQTNPRYGLGRTLVHEVGHYLGLKHPWGSNCADNDQIEDTPPQSSPVLSCLNVEESFECDGTIMIQNFMQFSDDPCLLMFTGGQVQRMHASLENQRLNLIEHGKRLCKSKDVVGNVIMVYNRHIRRLIFTGIRANESYQLQVFNSIGQLIINNTYLPCPQAIDLPLESYPAGVYLAILKWNGQESVLKFVHH